MSEKEITFKYKPWMPCAALAFCFVFVSYMLAVTFPTCPDCKIDPSFIQVWHGILSVVLLVGSVILTIVAFVKAQE